MGLYIKTKRVGIPIISYNDAVRYRALAALTLLRPFIKHGIVKDVRITIYKHYPLELEDPVYRPLSNSLEELLLIKDIESKVKTLLQVAIAKWKSLYDTYLFVEFQYEVNGISAPIYLAVSNGPLEPQSVELDSYDWIYEDKVVETLEETLEILEKPKIRELLLEVGQFQRKIVGRGFTTERAVVSDTPWALDNMTLAKAYWLPSAQRLLSLAIETLQKLREEGDETASEVYDYYEPHRRDLVVSLIANRKEYEMYLKSRRVRETAVIASAASIIVEARKGTLEGLFQRIMTDILKPYAEEVLETRKSSMCVYTGEFMLKFREKLLREA